MTLNNVKYEADKIRLTSAEKSAMRARIFDAQKGQSLESPELRTVLNRRSPYVFMSYHVRMSLAGLLLFVLAGTGTVSAAQGALPGDLLYPVKVSINEKVEVALAPTTAAKAEVQVRLAERRVDEARELSVRGRLDEKTAKILTDDFDEHSAQALALVEPDEQDEPEVKNAQVQTMMTISIAPPEADSSSTTPEREKPSVKKSGKNRSEIRESLREKGELLKEIKIRSQRQEIKDGGGEGIEIKIELQIDIVIIVCT